MKILYFTAFYEPETVAASYRATEHAKIWSQMGNDVTVFTGYPNYPKGYVFGGYTPKLIMKENAEGVNVIRSKVVAKRNTSYIKRLQNALGYYFFGRINTIFNRKKIGKDYDIVLGTTGVVFNALLAYKYARKNKIPFVLEIRDITFEQMIAVGKNPKSISVKCMKKLELLLCHKAKLIVVVSNGYKQKLVENGIPQSKISVITNGVDAPKREKSHSEVRPLLSYLGTVGISQDLSEAFDYAEVIRESVSDLEFLIVGDGAQKDTISQKALQTDYAKSMPGMPMEQLEPLYDQSMLSLVKLKKTVNFSHTIPSKIFQIMGRGVPVLFIGPAGETADIIRDNHAGIVLIDDKEKDFDALRAFFNQSDWKDQLIEMGKNGAAIVEKRYSRRYLAQKYMDLLQGVDHDVR